MGEDDSRAARPGALIALAVAALAAAVPLAAVADANEVKQTGKTTTTSRAANKAAVGGFVVPAIATMPAKRKPPVGIPGRGDNQSRGPKDKSDPKPR